MATATNAGARLNVRLASDHKQTIEEAAAALGQTVTDFAVSTLVDRARSVIEQARVAELSRRDSERLMAILSNLDKRPTKSMKKAIARYARNFG